MFQYWHGVCAETEGKPIMIEESIRVAVVAENPLARAGLQTLLTQQADCSVVGQLDGEIERLLDQLAVVQPDVIVWDVDWETDLDALATVRQAEYPILALIPDENLAEQLWEQNIGGILSRTTSIDVVVQALKTLILNLIVIDPTFRLQISPPTTTPTTLATPLTEREAQVLGLLVKGQSNKGIAYALGISDHTVKFHVNAIMTKLGAQSRTEAAVRATQMGLVSL